MSPTRRLPLARAVFPTAVALLLVCCAMLEIQLVNAAQPSKQTTVALTIDFGDGFQKRYTSLKYRDGMTVLDVMQAAARHSHALDFKYRGKKTTAFLFKIDGAENQGGRGRNWVYRVNGKLGDRSFAIQPLKAGDKVLWSFERYP